MRTSKFLTTATAALFTTTTLAQTTESLIATAAQIAASLKSTYPNPSLAFLPQPYWWWESGSAIDAFLTYGGTTGDKQHQSLMANTILNQATSGNDFMTADATGNDDQAWWALAAVNAAETNVPLAAGSVSWLALAQNVFNEQKARYDTSTCGGGLKWKINVGNGNDGWHYKSTISNGLFFQLAARLAKLTNNADTLAWAEKAYDWVLSVGLIDGDFNVFDGTDDTENCAEIQHDQWSYNTGVFLYGAAVMAAHTSDSVWTDRTNGLIAAARRNFVNDGALFETKCEGAGTCNTDQVSFKGILARWMGAAAEVLPDVEDSISQIMTINAAVVQSSWNAGLEPMGHFVDLEIVDAAIRSRGEIVTAQGFLGLQRKVVMKSKRRSVAGRIMF